MHPDFFHYSFLDGRVIGSENPSALGRLRETLDYFVGERGARALIALTEDCMDYGVPALAQYHVPIRGVPTREQVERAHGAIRRHLEQGDVVWVHCQQGVDRTGSVIGCYLVWLGQPAENVIAALFRMFPEHRRAPFWVDMWQPYMELIRSFERPARDAGATPARPQQ